MSAPSLFEAAETDSWLEKRTFSCLGDEIIRKTTSGFPQKTGNRLRSRSAYLLEQTVLDLLHLGYEVFLIADCVSSRKSSDLQTAIRRIAQAGAVVTSYEAILLTDGNIHASEIQRDFRTDQIIKGKRRQHHFQLLSPFSFAFSL